MANWIIRCAQDYLIPVTEHLQKILLERDIIHCDETPVQVLKEDEKKTQTKSYMWLYRTGDDEKEPISSMIINLHGTVIMLYHS